ncbi:MAG: hypothetical protein FVQ77_06995 [Cytophagales bacterium]|nr:hypothetical protein [Cytophagales bacterium]
MTKFTIGAYELEQATATNFADIISIIKGRSIVSGADWEQGDRFELGLSGNLMLRFFRTDTNMTVNLISTRNKDENPTLVIDMGDMGQRVPISVIETKLNGLRTLYAIYFLIHNDRAQELQSYLIQHPQGDIEKALLKEDEQLYIESISYGSWILTVWGKTKKAYKAIVSTAGLVFVRGREAFLSKLEADSRLKNAEADLKTVEVKDKQFELHKKQFDYLLEASEKMDIPEVKKQLKRRMIQATKNFTLGDKSDSDSFRQLEE